MLALSLALAACDAPVVGSSPPAAHGPLVPGPLQSPLARVRVDFDMTAGVARTTVVPARARLTGRENATATGAEAALVVDSGFVQTGITQCPACNNGIGGSHTVSVPLMAVDIFKDLRVDPRCGANCNNATLVSDIPAEVVPGDEFTVSVNVNVPDGAQKFSVYFDLIGTRVVLTLCVKSLGFADDHTISVDGTGLIADPVWQNKDCGEAQTVIEPVAYTSGTKIKVVEATLRATLQPQITKRVPVNILGLGMTPGLPMKFTFGTLSIPGSGGTVSLPAAAADNALPERKAAIINPLTIRWEYSFPVTPHATKPFAASNHPVYVTFAPPRTGTSPLYLTLLDHTTHGAAGKIGDSAVVAGVWEEFTDRRIQKRTLNTETGAVSVTPGTPLLTYYGSPHSTSQYTVDLLLTGDGQCGAWARYLKDALATQGLASELIEVLPTQSHGILVKNWRFEEGALPCPQPFTWLATDLGGVSGQGLVENPRSIFSNHGLIRHGQKLYDSSYGTGPFSTLEEWEEQSLDGFYVELPNGSRCYRPNQPNQLETRIVVTNESRTPTAFLAGANEENTGRKVRQ